MFFGSGIKRFSGRNIFFTGKIADSQISHLYKKVTDYCNLISRQRNLPEKQIIVPALKVKKLLGRSIFLSRRSICSASGKLPRPKISLNKYFFHICFHLLLTTRFAPAGLQALISVQTYFLIGGLAAKWAQQLITNN